MGVLVPVVQLLALTGLLVKFGCELIIARAQTAHLILRVAGDGLGDGEGFHLRAVFHRSDVEDMGPRLGLDGAFLATWNRIGSVFFLF